MRRLLSLLLVALACTSAEREKPAELLPPTALRYRPKPEEKEIASAQATLQKIPQRIDGWEQLATALIRRSRETADPEYTVLAGDLIEQARARFPREPRLEVLHLMMLEDAHRFREAKEIAGALVQRDPENVTAWILLGDAQLELGAYQEAAGSYQTAMDLKPDLRSYNRGAYLRWLHGEFDGALEMMELALDSGSARDPEPRAWCYVDLARMYWHRGDAERAGRAIELALDLVPGYLSALSLKARALLLAGDRPGAIALLSQIVEKRADTSDLLLLFELSEDPKAFERAAKLGEHDPRPLAHYLARHAREPQRALLLAKRARDDRPSIEAEDTYALAALRSNELEEARRAIEKATSLGTLDAEIWLHRALIEAAGGKLAEAKRSLARALELNPKVDPLLLAEAKRTVP